MNHYEEEFNKIAEDFNLVTNGFLCTLPGINPSRDCIIQFDYRKRKIYCAEYLSFGCGYICCIGLEELKPKRARKRVAELVEQYKQLQMQKKLNKMKEDFND